MYLPVRFYNYFSLNINSKSQYVTMLQDLRNLEVQCISTRTDKIKLLGISSNTMSKEIKTIRSFSNSPLSHLTFTELIMHSIGATNSSGTYFNFPSGGDLRPLKFYVLANSVVNIPRDIYQYEIATNSIIPQKIDSVILSQLIRNFRQDDIIDEGALYILISATYSQSVLKYSARGLRYIFMEAGHVMQNFYTASKKLNLGVTAIGGFPEKTINEILHLDTINESIIYCAAVGVISDSSEN